MWTPAAILVFVFLASSSQGYVLQEGNDLAAKGKFSIDTVESTVQMEQPKLDIVDLTTKVRSRLPRGLKFGNTDLLTALFTVNLANFDTIKTIAISSLKLLAANINVLIEEIEKEDISTLLDSPITDFVMGMVLPLLSDQNESRTEDKSENSLQFDSFNADNAGLNENPKVYPLEEITTVKADSMEIVLLEETSSTTTTQSPRMQKILAGLLLLLSVANATYYSRTGHHYGHWNRHRYPSKDSSDHSAGDSFEHSAEGSFEYPPRRTVIPPGHKFTPPGHTTTQPDGLYSLLEYFLLHNVNKNTYENCDAAYVCYDEKNPGRMIIKYRNGYQITFDIQRQQEGDSNQNATQKNRDRGCPNYEGSIGEVTTPVPPVDTSLKPQTSEPSRSFGGEGLIDVRIGEN